MVALLKHQKFFPLYWVALGSLALAGDYATGPFIRFPILFLIPITLASWYSGRWWGFALALSMPLVRAYFVTIWDVPWTMLDTGINTVIRMVVFLAFAFFVDRTAVQTRALAHELKVLRGLLPICSFCKKIRDHDNNWQPLEQYIIEHSGAQFSHTFCPECGREHYGDLVDD